MGIGESLLNLRQSFRFAPCLLETRKLADAARILISIAL
jgi:hypothetical protein